MQRINNILNNRRFKKSVNKYCLILWDSLPVNMLKIFFCVLGLLYIIFLLMPNEAYVKFSSNVETFSFKTGLTKVSSTNASSLMHLGLVNNYYDNDINTEPKFEFIGSFTVEKKINDIVVEEKITDGSYSIPQDTFCIMYVDRYDERSEASYSMLSCIIKKSVIRYPAGITGYYFFPTYSGIVEFTFNDVEEIRIYVDNDYIIKDIKDCKLNWYQNKGRIEHMVPDLILEELSAQIGSLNADDKLKVKPSYQFGSFNVDAELKDGVENLWLDNGKLDFYLAGNLTSYDLSNNIVSLFSKSNKNHNDALKLSLAPFEDFMIYGNVNKGQIDGLSLFPSFSRWYVKSIESIPITLITATLGGVQLLKTNSQEKQKNNINQRRK